MLDSDNAPTAPSSRRSLSWLLAGGVVGLVGVGCLSRHGEAHASFKASNKVVEQAENCASGGQPSSCTAPAVAKMTSYGAWTVCGPNAGLPTQTGVFVGGIEACEAKCTASSTCRGIQWVQGADSTQDICFEISDNICVHHTMTPPVAQNSVPPVQNAECIVKSCGDGPTGECTLGQTECCPASLKREVNVAGDKLVQRFVRRLVTTNNLPAVQSPDARIIKKDDGVVVVCTYTYPAANADANQIWAKGTVNTVTGEAITQTLNPHLKVQTNGADVEVVRFDPNNPTAPTVVGKVHVLEDNDETVACPAEVVQFQGRKLVCPIGALHPVATLADNCVLPAEGTWKFGHTTPPAGGERLENADGTAIANCALVAVTPATTHVVCPTEVFAAADGHAIVCDDHLHVLGMVDPLNNVEVDDHAFVKFDPTFAHLVVHNPVSAEGGAQDIGKVYHWKRNANGEWVGVYNCAGITCSTTSTCEAAIASAPGKWRGLLCVGVSPLPANLRGVFWKVNRGVRDHFPFIPDVIAFCANTDGCGKSLGHINAEGELVVDLRGEKVVDWLGTTVDIDDSKALSWIRENGHCKLTFTAVPGKGSRHSPSWFSIEASCDPTESGTNVIIPSYVTDQIATFNKNEPFMVWVHGSRYNSLLPRGCTAWALWRDLDDKRSYAQDAMEVIDLDQATARLVSIVDDRGYTLEECGYSHFERLYGKSTVTHYTYDNRR